MRLLLLCLLLASAGAYAADEDYRATAPANQRPMLGVEMTPVPQHVQDREGITAHQGVMVQSTYNNTAAHDMGIRPGDVILNVNGAPISSMTDLRNEVGLTAVGDPVQVQVSRNGQVMKLQAKVQEWPANIPYERLDSASERRFRDWQDRRQQRLAEDLRRSRDDLARIKRDLTGEDDDAPDAKGRRPGERRPGDLPSSKMPAVRITIRVATDQEAAARIPASEIPDPTLPDATPAVTPWSVRLRLPSATVL